MPSHSRNFLFEKIAAMVECGACGRQPAPNKCSRCKSVFYCDSACQRKDWKKHKPHCQPSTPLARTVERKIQDSLNSGISGMVLEEVEDVRGAAKMPPRPEMFPLELRDYVYKSSPDGADENLLILLHGFGDTHVKYAKFAKTTSLPQTATLALSGPIKIPEVICEGRAWFTIFGHDWELIEPLPGERRRTQSLTITKIMLERLLQALCVECGWQRNRIHLFGFSQGGSVALDLVLHSCGPTRLGGVVAISASLLPEVLLHDKEVRVPACKKDCTPVLITYGDKDGDVPREHISSTMKFFQKYHPQATVNLHIMHKGHEMVNSPEEMLPIMTFWAQHLHRRMLNLEKNATLYEIKS